LLNIFLTDPAVDFDVAARIARIDHLANLANFHKCLLDEILSAKTRFDAHDHDLIAVADQVDEHGGRRLRVDCDPGARADSTQVLQ